MRSSSLCLVLAVLAAAPASAGEGARGLKGMVPRFAPPTVKLLSAGKEPRRAIRRTPSAEPRTVSATSSGFWILESPTGPGNHLWPVITVQARATPAPGVEHAFDLIWMKAHTEDPPEGRVPLDPATAQTLAALEGASCRLALQPTGLPTSLECFPGPHDAKAGPGTTTMELRSFYALEMGKGILMQLLVPFPSEPVGPGARWQTERVATRGMLTFTQVATFELLSAEAGKVKLAVRYGARPDPASAYRPDEQEVSMAGGGELELDLARPFPLWLREEVEIRAQLGGKTVPGVSHQGTLRTRAESK